MLKKMPLWQLTVVNYRWMSFLAIPTAVNCRRWMSFLAIPTKKKNNYQKVLYVKTCFKSLLFLKIIEPTLQTNALHFSFSLFFLSLLFSSTMIYLYTKINKNTNHFIYICQLFRICIIYSRYT